MCERPRVVPFTGVMCIYWAMDVSCHLEPLKKANSRPVQRLPEGAAALGGLGSFGAAGLAGGGAAAASFVRCIQKMS
jgi:hypothetical protein